MEKNEWFFKLPANNETCGYSTNMIPDIELNDGLSLKIEGFVLPRIKYYMKYKDLSQTELIISLFREHGKYFIDYVKGVFVLVLMQKDDFIIFTDRCSIGKFFVYDDGGSILISNSLKLLANMQNLVLDKENAAVFTLTSHFFDGATLFKHVSSSKPGEYIEYTDRRFAHHEYWHPRNLFPVSGAIKEPIPYYANQWKTLANSYIDYLKPSGISVTLTGGNDSRMVLSALTANQAEFHAYTYGNPKSYDAVVAHKLSKAGRFRHATHDVDNLSSDWFTQLGNNLVNLGDSLVNIHRAHRLEAAIKEKALFPHNDIVFTGLVGGEFTKKPPRNDSVIPEVFHYLLEESDSTKAKNHLRSLLSWLKMDVEKINIDIVYDRLMDLICQTNDLSYHEKLFVITYLFYSSAHHTQDSQIYQAVFGRVVNLFMDVDFLEMLAKYIEWYPNESKVKYNRLFHSSFLVGITHHLAPEFSRVPYAKRGKYTAWDILHNKPAYLCKRLLSVVKREKETYPNSFELGDWMSEFCAASFQTLNKDITALYDVPSLVIDLKDMKIPSAEKAWHLLTNPINLSMICNQYG